MFATSTTRYARARRARGFLSFVSSSRATFSLGARAMFEPSSTHPPMMTPAARCPALARDASTTRVDARASTRQRMKLFF
jgi:hypothetical protein